MSMADDRGRTPGASRSEMGPLRRRLSRPCGLRLPSMRREEEFIYLEAMKYLNLVGLGLHTGEMAKNLPFGQQRLVAIARALAAEPRLLLLDEPAAGLNALEKMDLIELVRRLQEMGITVLIVEQKARQCLANSD